MNSILLRCLKEKKQSLECAFDKKKKKLIRNFLLCLQTLGFLNNDEWMCSIP